MNIFYQVCMLLVALAGTHHLFAQEEAEEEMYEQYRVKLLNCDPYDSVKISRLYHELFAYDSIRQNYDLLSNHMADYGKLHIALRVNRDTAIYYIDLAEKIAKVHGHQREMAIAQTFKALYLSVKYERGASLEYIRRAKKTYSELEHQSGFYFDKSAMLMMSADIYKVFNMFDSAMNNYQAVLKEAEINGRKDLKQKAELRIADLLEVVGDTQKSREIYKRILSDPEQADSAAVSIASRKLAGQLVKEDMIDSAKSLLQLAYQINQKMHKNSIFIRQNSQPDGRYPAAAEMPSQPYASTTDASMAPYDSGSAGNGVGFTNMPPYLAMNWIIALQGIFPSRN